VIRGGKKWGKRWKRGGKGRDHFPQGEGLPRVRRTLTGEEHYALIVGGKRVLNHKRGRVYHLLPGKEKKHIAWSKQKEGANSRPKNMGGGRKASHRSYQFN